MTDDEVEAVDDAIRTDADSRALSRSIDTEDFCSFRKRPVRVRAQRLDEPILVMTLEGEMRGEPGDWLIEGIDGELYPCDDDIFRETYQPTTVAAGKELDRELEDESE